MLVSLCLAFIGFRYFAGIGSFGRALFNKALLESLILAQDERWRRA
jgi:hypothetical protein